MFCGNMLLFGATAIIIYTFSFESYPGFDQIQDDGHMGMEHEDM